jgi:SAM-dependent methyltransferase
VKKEQLRNYFDGLADSLHVRRDQRLLAGRQTPYFDYKRRRFLALFRQTDFAGRSVLEVGCGPAGNLQIVAKAGAVRAAGCDISPKMIELARANLEAAGRPADLHLVDGEKLPFGDGEFDLVFTVTVLQHNADEARLARLMGEIARVARRQVCLFEDTDTTVHGWPSYMLRPVAHYAGIMARHGFRLARADHDRTAWSEAACDRIARLLGDASARDDNHPAGVAARALMKAVLPFTRLLDRLLPKSKALSRMVFER